MPGLQTEDLFLGVSQPRNEKLANVFYRLKHIEAYGTGLRRIMQFYEELEVKPEIKATHGAFMLILPNMNYARPLRAKQKAELKPQQKAVLDYLRSNSVITNKIVQELLGVKQTRAYAIIKELVSAALIVKRSSGRDDSEYVIAAKDGVV
jgi:ATP-dependent DNA helicase RecG